MYLGDINTVHLGYVTVDLYPFVSSKTEVRQTGDNFVAIQEMQTATSGYNLYPATCILV